MDIITSTQIVGGNPARKRSERDFYPTPDEVTRALLDLLRLPKNITIWEPAAGEGDMAKTMRNAGYNVIESDILTGSDFLTEPCKECDWIITNPPFDIADKFIERCAEHQRPFALLLKSQYFHARKRYELFCDHQPTLVCPLTWRPDFLFKKHTKRSAPLMDVIWCVWVQDKACTTIYRPLLKPEG